MDFVAPEFDIEIKDKKGIKNGVSDHLSRMKIEDYTQLMILFWRNN